MKLPATELCIECGQPLNAASYVGDDSVVPRPGDISLCLYCGHMTAFTDDMKRRALNDEEMHDVAGDPLILLMQQARGKAMK